MTPIDLDFKLCFCDAAGPVVPHWIYLSFCQADRPQGSQFVGACIVQGCCVVEAVREARRRGCNPGGEVMSWPSPEPRHGYTNRLLTRDELEDAYGDERGSSRSIGELESDSKPKSGEGV